LALPDGKGGIGFDDLLYSQELGKVLVPAGRSGRLDLVDPQTQKVESISGFSVDGKYSGGHGEGTTSADVGDGLIFASDRNLRGVVVVDAKSGRPVARVNLKAAPDYVRWVSTTHEVWVTEPRAKSIEVFKLESTPTPTLQHVGDIGFPDGPESLVVDAARARAYTHSWKGETYVVDLKTRKLVSRWSNGCEGSRGIALDESRGFLFVGCDEGKATVLDAAHDGKRLGTTTSGKGVDIIAYNAQLHHLYLPGGDSATMAVIDVGSHGELTILRRVPTAADAHCVAADDLGNAYVCDPSNGRLLVVQDGPQVKR
jgi:DNA-binding beta-propeller fold protein YncE